MKKTRVPKGESYWCIEISMGTIEIVSYIDNRYYCDNRAYESGNYYCDKDEAETAARKLKAVLKGAEVIEMPSEEDLKKIIPNNYCGDEFTSGERVGWRGCYRWLKSKIVK